jgi:hypothetical protein
MIEAEILKSFAFVALVTFIERITIISFRTILSIAKLSCFKETAVIKELIAARGKPNRGCFNQSDFVRFIVIIARLAKTPKSIEVMMVMSI